MKRAKTLESSCYMCEAVGTSREHVPPRSFFPPEFRKDLWTVPSCPEHNHANAKDVEYVRSLFALSSDTNDHARRMVAGSIKRSWEGSPGLKQRTFRRWVPALLNGRPTAIFEADLTRMEKIVIGVAYAIYYRDFGARFSGRWMVYSTSMIAGKLVFNGTPDRLNPPLRALLSQVTFDEQATPHPEVFRYGVLEQTQVDLIYRFTFYGGFTVYAVSMRG